MIKKVLTLTFFCLFLISGSYSVSNAALDKTQVKMQKHIDKVKVTKPGKYKLMFERAGGSIANCISCHQDFGASNNSSNNSSSKFR